MFKTLVNFICDSLIGGVCVCVVVVSISNDDGTFLTSTFALIVEMKSSTSFLRSVGKTLVCLAMSCITVKSERIWSVLGRGAYGWLIRRRRE